MQYTVIDRTGCDITHWFVDYGSEDSNLAFWWLPYWLPSNHKWVAQSTAEENMTNVMMTLHDPKTVW